MDVRARDRIKRQLARLDIEQRELALQKKRLDLEDALSGFGEEPATSSASFAGLIDLTVEQNKVKVKTEPVGGDAMDKEEITQHSKFVSVDGEASNTTHTHATFTNDDSHGLTYSTHSRKSISSPMPIPEDEVQDSSIAQEPKPAPLALEIPQNTPPAPNLKRKASLLHCVHNADHFGHSGSDAGKDINSALSSDTDETSAKRQRGLSLNSKQGLLYYYAQKFTTAIVSMPDLTPGMRSQVRCSCQDVVFNARQGDYMTFLHLHNAYNSRMAWMRRPRRLRKPYSDWSALLSDKLDDFCSTRPYWWAKAKKLDSRIKQYDLVDKVVRDVMHGRFDATEYHGYYRPGQPDPESSTTRVVTK